VHVSEVLIMIGVSAAAFVSTSLDNLFLLMGLMAGSRLRTRDAALGYGLALAPVLSIGVAGSYAADWVADDALRALGLIPLTMGIARTWKVLRAPQTSATSPPQGAAPAGRSIASVFAVMLANSGDSLAVFAPLMSETSERLVFVIVATALGMGALWSLAARSVVRHPRLAPSLRAIDRYAVPLMLIGIGIYILTDTPTDTV
jgi:cadmium resistance protein CadD (predicted permease)